VKRFFAFITQPWLLALIGIILLSLIIWYIGPLFAIADYKPLASETIRLVSILVIFIAWGLNNLRQKNNKNAADKDIADQLLNDAKKDENKDASNTAKTPDEEILSKRLSDAISMLQNAQFGKKGKLYNLPWYMIIGAPGSGKTTALKQSGLHFPLRSKLGDEPVQGAGGTRYCDWWFTDEAILIDTAGRYTTQDDPKKVETQAWLGFLSMLKKVRSKRPLNGIILTISLQDILQKTATQKTIQTTAIKQRIQELNNHLGMELPVYVIFTKTDMVAGFNSFFADLEKEDQEQVWGTTFPDTRAEKNDNLLEKFNSEFSALMERINNRVLNRLHHEHTQQRRTLVYEFPRQMHALKQPLHDFLNNIFIPNQFEKPFLFRGVYFISSTQTNMASQWVTGILPTDQCSPPIDTVTKEPKTFFVNHLLKKVIFSEANMATINAKAKNRYRWIYRGALALATVAFTSMLIAWDNSKKLNTDYIDQLDVQIQRYKDVTNGGLQNPHDWLILASGLNELKTLPTGYDEGSEDSLLQQRLGLYQGKKLGSQAHTTYLSALEAFFMKDLAELMIVQVEQAKQNDEQLYEALKFYLMLYYPDKMDREGFTLWVNILWNRLLPGEHNDTLREHLNVHLKTALDEQVSPPAIDQLRVDEARTILISTPLDQRLYRRLKNDYMDQHDEQYSISQVLGKKADIIFYRRSGESLDNGIPTLFTYKGFHTGFNVQNKQLAQRLSDEQWIYGDSLEESLSEEEVDKISQRVNEYYFKEYTTRWEQLISDLAIKSFSTVNRGQAVLRLLASSDQPLIKVLSSIRKHTALSEAPAISESTKAIAGTLAEDYASNEKNRLERLIPKDSSAASIKLPGHPVSDNFDELNTYINQGDGLPLPQLQQSLNALNDYFQTLAYAGNLKQAAFQASIDSEEGTNSVTAVRRTIAEAPPQIQRWFKSIARDTNKVTASATQGHMNNIWQTDVMSFFNKALKDRYPINAASPRDIKLDDFTAFFGPGGIMDNYFGEYIEPFVDSSKQRWKWKKNIGLSNRSLRLFERAQRIKKAYFNGSKAGPQVKFILKPHALDQVVSGFLLETAGSTISYQHGPVTSTPVVWPNGSNDLSKMVFTLASKGTPVSVRTEGQWSWFRLLDKHAQQTSKNNSDTLLMTFKVSGIEAQYELKPQSAYNPYSNRDIKNFTLPKRL